MLGGILNLKTKMPDRRVLVVNRLKLELPAELTPGAILVSDAEMENQPKRMGDEPTPLSWKCEVKEIFDASTLFNSLTGQAARMDCLWDGDADSADTRMYLEDLGLFISVGKPSADGSFPYVITRMDIER